jgi:integrase
VRRQWRQARAATGLDWVTPHTFRKTVATLIDKEADTKSAAAQLGHASEDVTDTYYIAKPVLPPDVSHILEQLGGENPDEGRAA